jgi:phenylalanyl-tRNA synthetase beta chain
MNFRTKDLQEFLVAKKINWSNVADLLNKKSFETRFVKDYLEVDILPNRFADAGNIRGLAKEISIIVPNVKFKDLNFKLSLTNFKQKINFKVTSPKCYHYYGRILFDIKNQKSPEWLKNFLKFYGFNSVNFIVDLSNYVMIKLGAPLHIFDLDKIKNNTLIVRQAKNQESFLSLKKEKFNLISDDIVISDSENILALAGIKGSQLCEVDLSTKNIFVEAAVFEPASIYRTSRRLNLISEASYRFERKIVPSYSLLALNYFSYLVQKYLKGKVDQKIYHFQKEKLSLPKITIELSKLKNYYGDSEKINLKKIVEILKKINCQIIYQNQEKIIVRPPSDRLDLNIDVDLIEEIVRILGYENLPKQYPVQFSYPQEGQLLTVQNDLRNFLVQINLTELNSYNFIDDNDLTFCKNLLGNFQPIEIINPNSNLYRYYRPFVFINLLKTLKKNLSLYNWLETKEFNFFEIGKVAYYKNNQIEELTHLGLVINADDLNKIYLKSKGIINKLFDFLNIKSFIFKPQETYNFYFEMIAEIVVNNKIIGLLLIPSQNLLNKYDLETKVIICELNINQLSKYLIDKNKNKVFVNFPQFPAVFRDISFVVPFYLQKNDLETEIINKSGEFLEKVELKDVYYLSHQEKSLTFHLVFRNKKGTLKDEVVNEIVDTLIKHLQEKFNIKIR